MQMATEYRHELIIYGEVPMAFDRVSEAPVDFFLPFLFFMSSDPNNGIKATPKQWDRGTVAATKPALRTIRH